MTAPAAFVDPVGHWRTGRTIYAAGGAFVLDTDPIHGFDLHPIAYLEARARAERSTLRSLDRVRAALFESGRYDITAGIGKRGEIEIDLDDDTPRDEDTARVVWRALFLADITDTCWPCFQAGPHPENYCCGHELEWA